MKKILLLSVLGGVLFLVSCKDDEEPAPPHEVGVWNLSSFATINFPDDFSRYDGESFSITNTTLNSYVLDLIKDGTFTRDVDQEGRLPVEEEGTWELSEGELLLQLDAGDESWNVEKNVDDDFWLSFEAQDLYIPNIYFDTVTQNYLDYLDTLTEDQLDSVQNELSVIVNFDFVFVFERGTE